MSLNARSKKCKHERYKKILEPLCKNVTPTKQIQQEHTARCHYTDSYSLFEHHVEHALRRVGLQEFHDVRMFEHVTYGGLALEVLGAEARAGGELGHIHDLDGELLSGGSVDATLHHTERAPAGREGHGGTLPRGWM